MTGKNRRTIMKNDAPQYRGPQQIENYYHVAFQSIYRKVRGIEKIQPCPFPQDSQRHFLTLWASACREGEAIMLDPNGWKWTADSLGYPKAPVLKKRKHVLDSEGNKIYKKVLTKVRQQDGSVIDQIIFRPESTRKAEYRDHLIPRDMPLIDEYIKIIEWHQNKGFKYMLFKRLPFARSPVPDQPCSSTIVQDRITELHPDLFPHALRALHVRYLRERYGKKFGTPELKSHLKWSSSEMAVYYLSGQDLADAMGITRPW